jgi:hypothetical protein
VVRKRYEIKVWGTVLFLDLGSASISEGAMDAAVETVKSFVYEVDEVFSITQMVHLFLVCAVVMCRLMSAPMIYKRFGVYVGLHEI